MQCVFVNKNRSQFMGKLKQVQIFGIPYAVGDLFSAAEEFVSLSVHAERPYLVAHSDVHLLTRILGEADYEAGLRTFDYICPDGMPIVWLMRRKDAAAQRLDGPGLMAQVWDSGRAVGIRHFLLGGTEETCALLRRKMEERFPGVQVAGHFCPPMGEWSPELNAQMIQRIRESGANCVWVGLGCPKQERWLYSHRAQLPPAVYFGVGAAFNFHAGLVKLAPDWIRSHGLEWAYRIAREPRRLFRRYLVHNTQFLWYCLTRKV